MAAITPNVDEHRTLGPLDSRFVQVRDLPWEKTRFAGIWAKTLLLEKETGLVTALIRMEPGAELPDHEHVRIEQTFVLEGELVDEDGVCTAGNFVWRPAGSRHRAHSPKGGVFLAIFQVPNRFYDQPGRTLDMRGADWDSVWGRAG